MSKPIRVAFQAALPQEVQPFLRRVGAQRLRRQEPLAAWEFSWPTGRGMLVVSGMGEDAAARGAAWIIEHYQPQSLVALGFGGAVTPELPAGAVVLGESYWHYDPETRELMELAPPPFPSWSGPLRERLRAAGRPVFPGSLITTRGIIPKAGHADLLAHLPYPVLDLETSAAALAARARQVPFLALRAVTDVAGEEIPGFLARAVHKERTPTGLEALAWAAVDPRRVSILYLLWRRSRLAAGQLSRALEMVLEVAEEQWSGSG